MLESAKVSDIMARKVVTVSRKAKIYEAARMMREQSIYSLPVVEDGKLVGLMTARDIVRRILADRRPYEGATVEEYMTKDVVTIAPDESVMVASKKMKAHGIGQLPVVDGQTVVGILSQIDIARAYPSYFKFEKVDRRWVIERGPLTTRLGYR